jgi:hypothetical protein
LIEAYLPPNEPPNILPYRHLLLASLADRTSEIEPLREKVVEIIKTTPLRKKIRSIHALEQMYMGLVMKDLRGKVNVGDALEIIRQEMESTLHIEEPRQEGGYYTVRLQSEANGTTTLT